MKQVNTFWSCVQWIKKALDTWKHNLGIYRGHKHCCPDIASHTSCPVFATLPGLAGLCQSRMPLIYLFPHSYVHLPHKFSCSLCLFAPYLASTPVCHMPIPNAPETRKFVPHVPDNINAAARVPQSHPFPVFTQSFYQPLGVVTQVPHTPALQSAAAELAQQRSRRSGAAPDPRTPKQLFHETWGTSLETQHCDPRFVPQAVAARSRTGPRILWVDDIIPEPDRDSGSIRTAAILNMLVADAFDVTYQPSTPRSVDYMLATQWAGIDVLPAWSPEQWAQTMAGGCAFDLVVVARRAVYQKWATQVRDLNPSPLLCVAAYGGRMPLHDLQFQGVT